MRKYSFKLPDLGEGIIESEVSEWHIALGDFVEEDQLIADVMTDKAIVEITSPVSGKITAMACSAGEIMAVGGELVCIESEENGIAEATPTSAAIEAPAIPKAASQPIQAPSVPNQKVLTSPSVRKRARELNLDLQQIQGSGKGNRIGNNDIDAHLARHALKNRSAATPSLATNDAAKVTEIKITGMRRAIAKKMLQAKRNIPHFSYIEEIDVTELEKLRRYLNAQKTADQPKLSVLPFLVKALVKALPNFSACNAQYDQEQEVLSEYAAVHMGIATMTPRGLLVPVVHNSQQQDLWQLARSIKNLAEDCRSGKCSPDKLSGSTITISSLGVMGGIASTPIINAPETCIVGINKIQDKLVLENGVVVSRKVMNVSSSFDHRIVDGYDAAQLIQAVKSLLETPAAIFI